MKVNELNAVARAMVSDGKGILAADESSPTIKKRFDSINTESTEEKRRRYREMLFTVQGLADHIGGVILFDETLRQTTADGVPFPEYLNNLGMLAGIKVDMGANAHALARYAALCQEAGIVPIVEPEVIMDGSHSLETCEKATDAALDAVFAELSGHRVALEGIVLKPNMVISGTEASNRAGPAAVAAATVRCLKAHVPAAVPGIAFLSGGQTAEEATEHLDLMNKIGGLPWELSFSYGRALQAPALDAWQGEEAKFSAGQQALSKRARLNSLAHLGQYEVAMESAA